MCRNCVEYHPQHAGGACPQKRETSGRSENNQPATCDEYGNRISAKGRYLLLRSKAPFRCGLYYETWKEFRARAPGGKLPQDGFNYRKPATLRDAIREWEGQGFQGRPPVIQGPAFAEDQ